MAPADSRSNNNIHKDQNLSSSHVTVVTITILPYHATSIRNMHRSGARAHRGDAPRSCTDNCLQLFTIVYVCSHLFISVYISLHQFTIFYNCLQLAYTSRRRIRRILAQCK